MMKKIFLALLLLLALVGGGLFYLRANLDGLVKMAIERVGSDATKAGVSVGQVKIELADGKGAIRGLKIGNPSGFLSPQAFMLGEVALQIDPKSLMGNGPVVIQSLSIDKPDVTYEVTQSGDTNLSVIGQNARLYADSVKAVHGATADGAAKPSPAKETSAERKIIIKNLSVTGGKIAVSNPLLQKPLALDLPAIRMTNVGADKGGVTPDQLAQILLGTLSSQASEAAASGVAKEMLLQKRDELIQKGGAAVEKAGEKLRGLVGF